MPAVAGVEVERAQKHSSDVQGGVAASLVSDVNAEREAAGEGGAGGAEREQVIG